MKFSSLTRRCSQLLRQRAIGIDISDHSIEVAELTRTFHRPPAIANRCRITLPRGIVERGQIRNAAELRQMLRDGCLQAQLNVIVPNRASIIFGLPAHEVYSHVCTLPRHESRERERLIFEEAWQHIPIPGNELLLTHHVRRSQPDHTEVLILATRQEVAVSWQRFLASSGFTVTSFDAEPLATFRGITVAPLKESVALIDIGARTTHISVFDTFGLWHTHSVSVAGDAITEAIVRFAHLEWEQAEARKRAISCAPAVPSSADAQLCAAVLDALGPIRTALTLALKHAADHSIAVTRCVLAGGTSQLRGLADHLSAHVKRPVEIGRSPLIDARADDAPFFTEAIGLALRPLNRRWAQRDSAFAPVPDDEAVMRGVAREG